MSFGSSSPRSQTTMMLVLGKASIMEEEEEEEVAAPAPKAPKLMGDAIKSGGAASKAKPAPKPKRNTRSIPAAEKNKAPVPEAIEEEEESVLRKLKPKIPDHNDAHPVAEDMKLRRDSGLRKWREADPYASRRRTAVVYSFHTNEQQDFYETVLLVKKPIVCELMGDAIRSGGAASKPKEAPKAASKPKPKRNTWSIPAAEKNKAPVPDIAEEEEGQVLRKLKPKIPDHNDAHPVAEDMKLRRDSGLRKWREADPYASRRRTAVDYRFHTKEQHDFYETVLLDKKPIVCDMRWVDWQYIKDNEEHYPGVQDRSPRSQTTTMLILWLRI